MVTKGEKVGRRRRKFRKTVIRRPQIPRLFQCPQCGAPTLVIDIDKKNKEAIIKCGTCGLHYKMKLEGYLFDKTYIYAKFTDKFLEGELKLEEKREGDTGEVMEDEEGGEGGPSEPIGPGGGSREEGEV